MKVHIYHNQLMTSRSRAWSFAMESMTLLLRSAVPPVLTGFAERTVIKRGYSVTSTQTFAEWDSSPSINMLLLTERSEKIYSFGIQDTCYKAELTAMWYPGHSMPCWGLAVRHTEWATHLAELERLQTGHRADWGNTISTFLPEDGGCSVRSEEDTNFHFDRLNLNDGVERPQRSLPCEGIRTLVNILLQLSEIVSSISSGKGVVRT